MTLHEQALALLEVDKGSWRETAEKAGLDYNWIQKLAQRKIADPGVNKIESLCAYLVEKHGMESIEPSAKPAA